MKTKTLRKALAVGLVAIASGYATQATAVPVFSFTEYGGFEGGMVGVATYTGPTSNPPQTLSHPGTVYSDMKWGTPAGSGPSSSMNLATVTGPTALAVGTWTTISTLTHNNFVINETISWGPQNVWGRFILTDSDVAPNVVLDSDEPVILNFTETPNGGSCVPSYVTPACNDHFTYNASSLNSLAFDANDGSHWLVNFRLADFIDSYHDEPNATVYTAEERNSHVSVQAMVTHVPEPGTIALLGLGLLGLGFVKRRGLNG